MPARDERDYYEPIYKVVGQILESEGIEVDENLDVSPERFRWQGPTAEWAKAHGFQVLPPDEPSEQVPDSQLRLF